jgi:hypothetical protein
MTDIKNIFILFLILCLIVLSCSSENKKSLQKNFTALRTIKYRYIDGKLDSAGTLYERIIFDKKGIDSIIENYTDNGLLTLRTIIYYDSTGNKVKSIDHKSDGSIESTTEYRYSNNGKLTGSYREHSGGGFNRSQFFYDSLGNRVKEIWTTKYYFEHLNEWYTSEDILLRTFNENGFCIGVKESADGKPFKDKKTVFDSLGHIIFEDWGDNYQKYTYDKNGNEIEHLYLDVNEQLVWRWVSVYDTKNVRINYTKYNFLNEPVEVLKTELIYE